MTADDLDLLADGLGVATAEMLAWPPEQLSAALKVLEEHDRAVCDRADQLLEEMADCTGCKVAVGVYEDGTRDLANAWVQHRAECTR